MITYFFSLVLVEVVGKDEASWDDANLQKRWRHVPAAMLSLFEICTFCNAFERLEEFGRDFKIAPPVIILFMIIASLGMLNMVTGLIVQAGFLVIQYEDECILHKVTVGLREMLIKAREKMVRYLQRNREKRRTSLSSTSTGVKSSAASIEGSGGEGATSTRSPDPEEFSHSSGSSSEPGAGWSG